MRTRYRISGASRNGDPNQYCHALHSSLFVYFDSTSAKSSARCHKAMECTVLASTTGSCEMRPSKMTMLIMKIVRSKERFAYDDYKSNFDARVSNVRAPGAQRGERDAALFERPDGPSRPGRFDDHGSVSAG